jgi:hypothetical protein
MLWNTLKSITNPSTQEKKEQDASDKTEEPKDFLSVSCSEKQVEITFADVKMEINFTQLK